jgi:hypothetical protein
MEIGNSNLSLIVRLIIFSICTVILLALAIQRGFIPRIKQ